MIGFIALLLVANIGFMLYLTIKKLINRLKLTLEKRKLVKEQQQILDEIEMNNKNKTKQPLQLSEVSEESKQASESSSGN